MVGGRDGTSQRRLGQRSGRSRRRSPLECRPPPSSFRAAVGVAPRAGPRSTTRSRTTPSTTSSRTRTAVRDRGLARAQRDRRDRRGLCPARSRTASRSATAGGARGTGCHHQPRPAATRSARSSGSQGAPSGSCATLTSRRRSTAWTASRRTNNTSCSSATPTIRPGK